MDRKELVAEAKKAGIAKAATTKTEELVKLLTDGTDEVATPAVVETSKPAVVKTTTVKTVGEELLASKDKGEAKMYKKEITPGQRLALLKADLQRREAVVIIDKQRSLTTDDGEAPLEFFAYTVGAVEGNAWVNVNSQERQYIERGILQVMEDAVIDTSTQTPGKMTADSINITNSKRFVITRTEGMTDEEVNEQIAREKGRLKTV